MEKRKVALIAIVLLLITLPYGYAALAAGKEYVFGGFLFNPIDGNSYLAKMMQGWSGSWKFSLLYTAAPGEGASLFLFYLLLGHISRIFGLPVVWVFHLMRVLAAGLMLWMLDQFFSRYLKLSPGQSWKALILSALGSGMGWLVIPAGAFTADFWVAEAYPFLSSFANPHFPLAIALCLWIWMQTEGEIRLGRLVGLALAGFALAEILPFGVVVALAILLGWTVWNGVEHKTLVWQPLVWTMLGAAPVLGYQYWLVRHDPLLAGWNAQNLTPAPPLWDLLLSLSPALIAAVIGLGRFLADAPGPRRRLAAVWLVLGLALVYFPFALQRRFMLGLYIPAVAMAAWLADVLSTAGRSWVRWLWRGMLALSVPTNLAILLAGLHGIQTHDPVLFLTRGESRALEWVRTETPPDATLLASPEMGMFIPAQTGRRVLYGHPFETVDAEKEKRTAETLYEGRWAAGEAASYLISRGIDYIWYGPREQALGERAVWQDYPVVYERDGVVILAVEGKP